MKVLMTTALLIVAACGDDKSAYQGIYEATSWTENETSCDAEGEDVLADQFSSTFYVKEESFFGQDFLNLNFCDDVADCEELAGDDSTIYIGMYGFDQGSDSNGWRSEYFSGFAGTDDVCEGVYRVATMTQSDDDSLRVEIRDTAAGGFAPDSDGFCDDDAGKDAAQGQPCTELEVFAASFVTDLP